MTTKELYVPTVNRCPDNDLSFGVPQIVEASDQAQRDPANLTDRQLEIIASYAWADAQIYARQRAEARAKAAAPPPVPAAPAGAPRRTGLTVADFSRIGRILMPVLRDYVTKRLASAEPNAELEAVLARLNGLIVLHEGRIAALESSTATPGPRWSGEHEDGKRYVAGELVRRKGDVWLCVKDSSAAPGMALGDWELFVRGGQARP